MSLLEILGSDSQVTRLLAFGHVLGLHEALNNFSWLLNKV